MKLLPAMVTLLLAACDTASQSGSAHGAAVPASGVDEVTAIHAALDSGLVPSSLFLGRPGRASCTIHGGGPAPGLQLSGMCATSTTRDSAGVWTVAFTEYWEGRQFHYQGEPSTGQLSHSWLFAVDSKGNVSSLGQRGNFPPQAAF